MDRSFHIKFDNLNLEEVDHILDVINSYVSQLEFDKLDKFNSSPAHKEWIDKHIEYHKNIMKKMKTE